jgi:carotenoid cleavage dioxygenase-like enzyme
MLQVDPDTGELHFFGYEIMNRPYCTYSVADAAGKRIKSVPIDIPDPVMMHDFAITTNYAIFVDCPLVFNPEARTESRLPPHTHAQRLRRLWCHTVAQLTLFTVYTR